MIVEPARARELLEQGQAVVLPNPSPLTCVVAATSPAVVNAAKGRPERQNVAVWGLDDDFWSLLRPFIDLPDTPFAFDLLRRHPVTALLPVRGPLPRWAEPAVRDRQILLFGTRWEPVAEAVAGFGHLYVSSANRTGRPPAATAAQAREMFGDRCAIVDRDVHHSPHLTHRATTMVRIAPDGSVHLARSGATDEVVTDVVSSPRS
ncbi:hypothetical protein [Kineosporia succinea]|uniref:tRNA A37 threonylcarbamoyladenosine synthetase subunit TsaC/SUA5/YrdC n=1 Tax=Kineosporia succinea TaxID=84632 RepID=A0ABT9PEB7_9ACTN|nr:hypothetical protein [Kineosporia succinea]MDP9831054.1 tRNA A37 threonylcarbamoyladenosine synthetase subunit TsaC/SUA5/YrdC [Kineosporia succinea]